LVAARDRRFIVESKARTGQAWFNGSP